MLLKNELKKLYIKQYGLIVLLIVFIVKLLTSADLYKASYSDMLLLSATQNAKSGKRRDKPKLSGINQHKADCYAVCCVSQVVYPARFSKVSCQKNRCVFAPIFYIC